MKRPIITLLTDFGTADHYVAAMKGVILGICPHAELVDISHDVTPYSIPEAAYTLAQVWHCFPKGTTHLVVVDPGVGSSRRAIVAEAASHRFVSPDNGVLSFILRAVTRATVREISQTRFFRDSVSCTFHGRDIFAPVSAHLANGIAPKMMGNVISDTVVSKFSAVDPEQPGPCLASVLKIDRFGNIITNLASKKCAGMATRPFQIKIGRQTVGTFHHTYADAQEGEIFVVFGSSGFVEISMNQSDASNRLEVKAGAELTLEFRGQLGTRTRPKSLKE